MGRVADRRVLDRGLERRLQCGHLGPRRVQRAVREAVEAALQAACAGLDVRSPEAFAAAEIRGDEVEAVEAGKRRAHPEIAGVVPGTEPVGDDAPARGCGAVRGRSAAHVGQECQATGRCQAHPGAARFQVTPTQDRGAAAGRGPPGQARGRAGEEFVPVGSHHQREARLWSIARATRHMG